MIRRNVTPFRCRRVWGDNHSHIRLFGRLLCKVTPVAAGCYVAGLRGTVVLPVGDVLCFNSSGAAIFFEFKHYKPKKRFTSTKCFAFMEMDEIKPGPIVIEL